MTIFSKVLYWENIKKCRKKTLMIIPFFFTFANAILGLMAVFKALDCEFITAAYCILLAGFMDTLDGRLARAFGSTSLLGMELDSLCDAISFCLAPVVLLYSWEIQDFGVPGFIALSVYLCSGLFRLAKFNVISNVKSDEPAAGCFFGLPTPVGAFFLTCLVLHHDWLETNAANFLLKKNVLLGLLICVSFLMISTIKFPAFKTNSSLKKNKGILFYIQFLLFAISAGLCLMRSPFMLLIPILYIFLGCGYYVYSKTGHYPISKP